MATKNNETSIGRRLITQNLIVSASAIGRDDQITWQAVNDLSVFIDSFCLFDKLVILGREYNVAEESPGNFGDLIRDSGILETRSANERAEEVSEAGRGHLLTYLKQDEVSKYDELITEAFRTSKVERVLSYAPSFEPDTGADLEIGTEWLKNAPERGDILDQLAAEQRTSRATQFLVRSFLYLAYGNVNEITFVPDSARTPALSKIVANQNSIYNRVIESMEQGMEELLPDLNRTRYSPLASVVFERSRSRRHMIDVLMELREDLSDIRKNMRKAEKTMEYGKGARNIATARETWDNITESLRETYRGKNHNKVNVIEGITMATEAAKLYFEPENPKNWNDLNLMKLPLDCIKTFRAKRPILELHQLSNEIPASGRHRDNIKRLFMPR